MKHLRLYFKIILNRGFLISKSKINMLNIFDNTDKLKTTNHHEWIFSQVIFFKDIYSSIINIITLWFIREKK